MVRIPEFSLAVAAVLLWAASVSAQVAVQQPIVDQFGVQTVVSVPDRGSILLGSLSRGSEARGSSGFLPTARGVGRSHEHQAVWASVWIHDLDAMDQALLARAADIRRERRLSLADPAASTAEGNAEAVVTTRSAVAPARGRAGNARLGGAGPTPPAVSEEVRRRAAAAREVLLRQAD